MSSQNIFIYLVIGSNLHKNITSRIILESELAGNIFPDIETIFVLLDNTYGRNRNPREFLIDLINLIGGIYDIDNIKGLSDNNLKLIKQDLLDRCFSIFFKKGLTINTLETLGVPNYIIDLAKTHSRYLHYYNEFEPQLILSDDTKPAYTIYKGKWKTSGIITQQRNILWQLSGGRDFKTGRKFIDLYKDRNPDGLSQDVLNSMTDKQLENAAKKYTVRHHFKTDIEHSERIKDCRVSAVVLIWKEFEKELHNEIDSNPTLGDIYAKRFENTIEALLQGRAPSYWFPQYRNDFNNIHYSGENTVGIKFFFYQQYI